MLRPRWNRGLRPIQTRLRGPGTQHVAPQRERHAPLTDPACRISLRDILERGDGRVEPERVEESHAAIERVAHLGFTRRLEVHGPQALGRHATVLVGLLGHHDGREREQSEHRG